MRNHQRIDWNLPDKLTNWTEAQAAILMDIREDIVSCRNSLDAIKHFFHKIGTERCRLIIQEAGLEAQNKRKKRLRK